MSCNVACLCLVLCLLIGRSSSYSFNESLIEPILSEDTIKSCQAISSSIHIDNYFLLTNNCILIMSDEFLDNKHLSNIQLDLRNHYKMGCPRGSSHLHQLENSLQIRKVATKEEYRWSVDSKTNKESPSISHLNDLATIATDIVRPGEKCYTNNRKVSCYMLQNNTIYIRRVDTGPISTHRIDEIPLPSHLDYDPSVLLPFSEGSDASIWLQSKEVTWFYVVDFMDFSQKNRVYLKTYRIPDMKPYINHTSHYTVMGDYKGVTVQYCDDSQCLHIYHAVRANSEMEAVCLYMTNSNRINLTIGIIASSHVINEINEPYAELFTGAADNLYRIVASDHLRSFFPLLVLFLFTFGYMLVFAYISIGTNDLQSVMKLHRVMENEVIWVSSVLQRLADQIKKENEVKPDSTPAKIHGTPLEVLILQQKDKKALEIETPWTPGLYNTKQQGGTVNH